MAFPILPFLAAAAPAIGSIVSGIGKGPKRQFKYSKKLFDYQAAYNHPIQQMERLKAAGLNPNLVYGEGTKGATGQQTGMDGVDFSQGPDYGSAISSGISTYMSVKDASLKNEQQSIQNSLLNIDHANKSDERYINSQVNDALFGFKSFKGDKPGAPRRYVETPTGGYEAQADAKRMEMGLIKQRYLNNQIDLYIKDQTKADVIKAQANEALMKGAGATLREQEVLLKKAEVNWFNSLPRSSVQPIIQVLKMLFGN